MSTESVSLIQTQRISPNPDNPRLIFHQEELEALQESIRQQGILVPLTVYRDKKGYTILDGERRWRCAVKLGLASVPAILQPKPEPLQNLMMMFAIHHRRNEWDPLPTALKLKSLEELYEQVHRRRPTEKQLAELASLTRGEVRRYKKMLDLPGEYREMLLRELFKPRSKQLLTVDHVLEATAASNALVKKGIIEDEGREDVRRAIVNKFLSGVLSSTIEPRKLVRLARSVERGEISVRKAREVVERFLSDRKYTINELYDETVAEPEFYHSIDLMIDRLGERLGDIGKRKRVPAQLRSRLGELRQLLNELLAR